MATLRYASSTAVMNIVANQLGLNNEEAKQLKAKLVRTVFLNDKSLIINTLEWVIDTPQGIKTISPTACFSNRDCRIIFEYEVIPGFDEKEIIVSDYQMVPQLSRQGDQEIVTYTPVLPQKVAYAKLKRVMPESDPEKIAKMTGSEKMLNSSEYVLLEEC